MVKLGGHALTSLSASAPVLVDLAHDIAQLQREGTDVVVVHGGGPQIAQLLERVGLEGQFHEGLRLTDAATMEWVAMALSLVNLRIVAALNQSGLAAIGLSGADGSVFRATALGEKWGRAALAPVVGVRVVRSLWASGLTPILSSIALDDEGELLNCNADSAAGALAGALGARSLVLLSDVDQLRSDPDDPCTVLASVTSGEVRGLIESGAARGGMRPKMVAAIDALDAGALRVLLANGVHPHALVRALGGLISTTEVGP